MAGPRVVALGGFAGFGLVWGMYAAAVPAVKAATGASDGMLGAALTCAGLAALPAMTGAGRLADRFGRHAFAVAACLLAVTAPLPLFAGSVPALIAGLLAFGGTSGAFDVVINHLAVECEVASGRRMLNKAHAVFSCALLAGSLGTGALRGAGVRPAWLFVAFGGALLLAAWPAWRRLPAGPLHGAAAPSCGRRQERGRTRIGIRVWLLGALGAAALLVESGVQQWCAVLLEDVLHAAPVLAGLGPALFAGAEALGRANGQRLISRHGDVRLLVCSGLVAAPGAVLLGAATSIPLALAGIALTGIGISVAAPTLYGLASRGSGERERGRAVATVSGVAYVGLLGGPGVVGQIAGATSLHLALALLAPAALTMALGTGLLARRDPALRRADSHLG